MKSGPASASGTGDASSELRAELAAQTEYLGVIGHELRNTMAPLLLLLDRLEMRAGVEQAPAWLAAEVEGIQRRARSLAHAVETIGDVARLSEGRVNLELAEVDFAAVVRDLVHAYADQARAASATLAVSTPESLVGEWDRARLAQIVEHLLSNAIRYGASPIEVELSRRGDRAELVVSDRGPGIDPAEHARLFERFERIGRARAGGFGIGLWVVKTLCNAMGGRIRVQSAVGQGARFVCELPVGRIRE